MIKTRIKFGRTIFLINIFMCFMYMLLTAYYILSMTTISANVNVANRKLPEKMQHKNYTKNDLERNEFVRLKKGEKANYFGPGEFGQPVKLDKVDLGPSDLKRLKAGFEKHGFNEFASDLISSHRRIGTINVDPGCANNIYDNLSPASIVIPVRDESWSILLRTLHSILSRTPLNLLQEIILVDDNSKMDNMKGRLDWYISHLQKVKILRLDEKRGRSLMVARQEGINKAVSDIVIVIDSHTEVTEGWIEPLIQRIREKPNFLVAPIVDQIFPQTLEYDYKKPKPRAMSFDFHLEQDWISYKQEYLNSISWSKPYRTTGIQGNALVFNKTFFNKLGGLDTGMKVWGGEQQELMFKYVMCGGDIEIVPCSHIGHVYRQKLIWSNELHNKTIMDEMCNQYRVAEVWMDEYKHLVFNRLGNYTRKTGDVSSRKRIREENKCKPFQYVLDRITQMIDLYIPVNLQASGAIVHSETKLCLSYWGEKPFVGKCHGHGYSQFWDLSKDFQIRCENQCLVYEDNKIKTKRCEYYKNQKWKYLQNNWIQHIESGMCLKVVNDYTLSLEGCSQTKQQTWYWERKS
ncbi:polypeptide N-acetylgalactosaminyltransferase 5-like [Mytilus edulis]|uniref:polypeptide N-acetylgalactosaminyltransferase 5-like n=1 Tax=Mytilus edulis TaxID=6550 RepID=UPI0039F0679C